MNQDLSYSMFIDNQNCNDVSELKTVQPRKLATWVQDDTVTHCYCCKIEFTFFLRKHHCRACGRIFCANCTTKRIYLHVPELNENKLPCKPGSFQWRDNVKQLITLQNLSDSDKSKERACDACYNRVHELKRLWDIMKVFDLVGFDYITLTRLSRVCKLWRQAALACISTFRETQYLLPNHQFNEFQRSLLWNNRALFSGHSKWMTQLLQSLDNNEFNLTREAQVIRLLKSPRRISCWNIMCTRTCDKQLGASEIVPVLLSKQDLLLDYPALNKELVNGLTKVPDEELICMIPLIVKCMANNRLVLDFVRNKCKYKQKVRLQVYWYIVYLLQQTDRVNRHEAQVYSKLSDNIMMSLNDQEKKHIKGAQNLICNAIYLSDKPIEEFKRHLEIALRPYEDELYLPFNPNLKVISIDYKDITEKSSSTHPIIIPMLCTDISTGTTQEKTIIIKKENLQKDQIIINIIKLMDIYLKRHLGLDCNIMTYHVLPSSNNRGIIEVVSDADTIYDVTKNQNMSILNYILEHNPTSSVNDVREKFRLSTAAYCVITYLLGIGDRHLDNIMISKQGKLFHIDYGYILGNDPKLLKPQIKMVPEMIDALGGKGSSNYNKFEKLASDIYDYLRSHINIFIYMIDFLSENSDLDSISARNEIIQRFRPGQGHDEAKLQLQTIITNSHQSRYNHLVDFLHYHNRENTISTTLDSLSKTTYDWLVYFYNKVKK